MPDWFSLLLEKLQPAWKKQQEPVPEDYIGKIASKSKGFDAEYVDGTWVDKYNRTQAAHRGLDPTTVNTRKEEQAAKLGPRLTKTTTADKLRPYTHRAQQAIDKVAALSSALGLGDPGNWGGGAANLFPTGVLGARRLKVEKELDLLKAVNKAFKRGSTDPNVKFVNVYEDAYRYNPRLVATLDKFFLDKTKGSTKDFIRGQMGGWNPLHGKMVNGEAVPLSANEIRARNATLGGDAPPELYWGSGQIRFPEMSAVVLPEEQLKSTAIHELGHSAVERFNPRGSVNMTPEWKQMYGDRLKDLNPAEIIAQSITRNQGRHRMGLKGDYKKALIDEMNRRWYQTSQELGKHGGTQANSMLSMSADDLANYYGWNTDLMFQYPGESNLFRADQIPQGMNTNIMTPRILGIRKF